MLRLDPDEKLKQDSIILNSTLPSLKTIIELSTKNYVDNKFNDHSIIKNTDHVDFKDKNLDIVSSNKVNRIPTREEHLTPKLYVDNSIYDIISCVHKLHEINRNRRDLSSVFNDQDNEFDNNKLTNLDSITVNRDPSSDNKLANKYYIDDSIGEGTIVRFNQTPQNYLKLSVGNDTYNPTNYDKIQITDTTVIKYPITGRYLLQNWVLECNDKNHNGKIQNFIKSTQTNSPTGYSGAESSSPIGNSFMYIETSFNNHGNNVFVSFERTDIIQISNITFYYNRFSILTNNSLKSMGRLGFQLFLKDNTWSTRYNIPKNDQYSDTSSQWTKLRLNLTEENYGIKLIFDEIDSAHSDMCFSNKTITHSVY